MKSAVFEKNLATLPVNGEESDAAVREKLLARGTGALTDEELLSVVLREGGKDLSALEVSRELLTRHNGSLAELSLAGLSELRMVRGMNLGRAAVVAAAMELGRRRKAEEALAIENVSSNDEVVALFKPLLAGLPHEEFWAVYLGPSNRILEKVKIGQGGTAGVVVDYKLIVKRALDRLASSMIVVHNHPSGNPSPGESDRMLTERLRAAAELFDIRLLDHVIVTPGESFSFRAEGLL